LAGKGTALSQQAGGIGTKGPGEKKLEIDKRRIKTRLFVLKKEIKKIKKHRTIQRERRKQIPLPMVTLIGYTNTGKSTLFNNLTNASSFVENKLFATLDPTIRQIILPNGQKALLSDTVGFIRKLPHQLITAFRATLEEVSQADILLHIIDSSHKERQEQIKATYQVLNELGVKNREIIKVYNKTDLLSATERQKDLNREKGVFISALKNEGIQFLLNTISNLLERELVKVTMVIPSYKNSIISKIFEKGIVLRKKYNEDKLALEIKLPKKYAEKFKEYIVKKDS
jgi:GTP-binding protein HflX